MDKHIEIPEISEEQVRNKLRRLGEVYCAYCGISKGCRSLVWDCMIGLMDYYLNIKSHDLCVDYADEIIKDIEPDCLRYDIILLSYDDYLNILPIVINEYPDIENTLIAGITSLKLLLHK